MYNLERMLYAVLYVQKILEAIMEHDKNKDAQVRGVRTVRKNFRLKKSVADWLSGQSNQTKVVTDALELYRSTVKEDTDVRL